MVRAVVVCVVVAMIAPAAVAGPKKLTRDQLEAASKAAAAKLPPVDRAASRACQAKYVDPPEPASEDDQVARMLEAGRCFRAAGALSAAIMQWKIAKQRGNVQQRRAAQRELGPVYEVAGNYYAAADAYLDYGAGGSMAGPMQEPDAEDQLIRALCLFEQLGADRAQRAWWILVDRRRKAPPSRDTVCDAIPPIAVP